MKDNEANTIGRNIKNILKKKGLRQNWLAYSAKVQESTISQYISGKRIPRYEYLKAIADALGVRVSDLKEVKK